MNYVESHEATESFNDTVYTASGPSKDEIGRTRISKGAKYGMESEKLIQKYGIPEQLRIPEWVVTLGLPETSMHPRQSSSENLHGSWIQTNTFAYNPHPRR